MSKIHKIVCDNCGRELPTSEWYFKADILHYCESSENGIVLEKGDYCKSCMRKICDRIKLL